MQNVGVIDCKQYYESTILFYITAFERRIGRV